MFRFCRWLWSIEIQTGVLIPVNCEPIVHVESGNEVSQIISSVVSLLNHIDCLSSIIIHSGNFLSVEDSSDVKVFPGSSIRSHDVISTLIHKVLKLGFKAILDSLEISFSLSIEFLKLSFLHLFFGFNANFVIINNLTDDVSHIVHPFFWLLWHGRHFWHNNLCRNCLIGFLFDGFAPNLTVKE